MSDNERVKKPEPERTQPIRNWSTLFGIPAPSSTPGVPAGGAPPVWAEPPSPGAAIPQSVSMGYRVIEDYMRKGQEVARSMWTPSALNPSASGGQQRMMEDMGRQTLQLATLWLDVMAMMVPGAPGARVPPAPGGAQPFSTGGEAASPEPAPAREPAPPPQSAAGTVLAIEILSSRRAEVVVDLRPGSCGLPLRVHDLRAPDPDRPRLTKVSIESTPSEDRIAVRIQVPDDLPPDVYSGMVLDERTSLPRGTLSVRISAA